MPPGRESTSIGEGQYFGKGGRQTIHPGIPENLPGLREGLAFPGMEGTAAPEGEHLLLLFYVSSQESETKQRKTVRK